MDFADARRVPTLRMELLDFYKGLKARSGNGQFGDYLDPDHVLYGWTLNSLECAEQFHVSEEMCEVTDAATPTLPWHRLGREDLPAEAGFIVFARPILVPYTTPEGPVPLRAAHWGTCLTNGAPSIQTAFYAEGDVLAEFAAKEDGRRYRAMSPLVPWGGHRLMLNEVPSFESAEDPQIAPAIRLLVASWLLMQQTVSVEEKVRPQRAEARRVARLGGDPYREVRIIRLRRPAGSQGVGEGSREYKHRWVVRGHWRRQWYASRSEHIPIWINSYIAGPDGAPILGGERVYQLSR